MYPITYYRRLHTSRYQEVTCMYHMYTTCGCPLLMYTYQQCPSACNVNFLFFVSLLLLLVNSKLFTVNNDCRHVWFSVEPIIVKLCIWIGYVSKTLCMYIQYNNILVLFCIHFVLYILVFSVSWEAILKLIECKDKGCTDCVNCFVYAVLV